jgi:murein DD-endopeptidase MepM/ murein hydrolase activator NlpD/protocatechuate 3,4-dioxygenase beta subunit
VVALVATSGGVHEPATVPPAIAIAEPAQWPTEPPRITVPPAPSITARVLAGGAAVADAEVSISDGSAPLRATARTDRDGIVHFAELEPGAYELWAAHGTSASAIARVMDVAPSSRIDIVLDRPAAPMHGRVEVDGQLPSDASVQLVPLDLDHATRVATIDHRGDFALAALPYGRWRVEVSATGYVQMAEQTIAVTASPEPLVVRLQRTGTVSGTVVDARGTSIANATIVLRDPAGTAAQRPVTLTPSRLRWVHPLAGTRVIPENESSRFAASRPGSRPAECGRGHCGIDLVQPRGSIVHAVADGHVAALYPESRSEAGRYVVIQHGGGLRTLYMHLDELRPGLEVGHPIRAGEPVGLLGSTGFTRSVPHLHFAITHETGGRTWYLDPEAMLRAAVVLPAPRPYDPIDAALATKVELATPAVATITADARGAFRIDGVVPGSYVAAAFSNALAPGVSSSFAVRSGDDVTGIVVELSDGVLVRGRVVGRNGPIAGATVIAGAGMGETAHKIATTYTDKHGEYALRSLAGKITLTATAASYGEAERAIALVDNRDHQREDFTLTIEDAQLRGVVLAPDGGAAAGVSVRIVQGTTRRRTVSDAFGRFTIAPVATGRYVVEVSSLDYPPKRIMLDSDRYAELRLEAGGGARALIRDAHNGTPLPNIRVEATGPANRSATRTTDRHGLVELRGLDPGAWKLAVRAPGYVAATHALAIRSGRGLDDTTIDLVRGATLAGEVRDHFGRRVAGARVSLGDASTTTDKDGAFRLKGVASGTLEAEHEGHRGSVDLRLSPGDERLSLSITLED